MATIIIRQNAAENSITIDGHRFDVPTDPFRATLMREMVVNAYCHMVGQAPLYSRAINAYQENAQNKS